MLFFSFFSTSFASSVELARELRLWEDPMWSKLLFYKTGFFGGIKSDIRSKTFFLHKDGKTSPENELLASLRSFESEKGQKLKCKFISRYWWLKSKLGLKEISCPKFNDWTQNNSIKSLSVIFATGYLGNPASYFGHPLLKFNFEKKTGSKNLLDVSVNYGANTPKQVNPFLYAFKGIFGGYDASFSHLNFYYNSHNYIENELRDLWEYKLKLTDSEERQIVRTTWELLGVKFPYYFFKDNCANRMAELLEIVINQSIMPKSVPYSIPHTLFTRLVEMKLVDEIIYHPSRKSLLSKRLKSLSKNERKNVEIAATDGFKNLTLNSKELEVLFDYYSFRLTEDKSDLLLKTRKREALLERIKRPIGKAQFPKMKTPEHSPHNSQNPVLTRIGSFYTKIFELGGTIQIRPAYYDLLSIDLAESASGGLGLADIKFSFNKDHLWLNYFDLLSIESLNISDTGLPGDGGFASKIKAGFENIDLSSHQYYSGRIEYGTGKAIQLGNRIKLMAYFNTRLQTRVKGSGYISLEPEVASLIKAMDAWKIHMSVSKRYYLNGSKTKNLISKIENRFFKKRNWDIRLSYKKHVDEKFEISYGHFW
jgi:hypothetical protein